MFDELQTNINTQNLLRVRQNQRTLDHSGHADDSLDSQETENDEFSERLQMFHILMQDPSKHKTTQNHSTISQLRRLHAQHELLSEKMGLQEQQHQKELAYLGEKHEREADGLKAEVQKYQCQIKRQIKEEGVISMLQKQNRQLNELLAQKEEINQEVTQANRGLKNAIFRLKGIIQHKEEHEVTLTLEKQQHSDNSHERKLEQEVINLGKQLTMDSERKKRLEHSLHKVRSENDQLLKQLDQFKLDSLHERQMLVEKGRGDVRRLDEENREVKRRNQKLEESLIEHLTQTSLNLQQTLKHQPERTKHSSLYLNETPIRSQSRGRERVHSPDEEEDPEKSQMCDQKHHENAQLNALKGKLKHANCKIVQLLHQKCQAYQAHRPK